MKKRTSSRILRVAASLCLVFALFCTMGMMAFAQTDDVLGTISEVFPDENLAQVMAVTLNKSVDDTVTRGELERVSYIDGANCGIKSLEGMQYISKASHVYLSGNAIADLRPLKNLTEVTEVHGIKIGGQVIRLEPKQVKLGRLSVDNPTRSTLGVRGNVIDLNGGVLNIITGGVDFYGLKEAGEVSYEIGGWISNSTNQSYSATIIQPYYL